MRENVKEILRNKNISEQEIAKMEREHEKQEINDLIIEAIHECPFVVYWRGINALV